MKRPIIFLFLMLLIAMTTAGCSKTLPSDDTVNAVATTCALKGLVAKVDVTMDHSRVECVIPPQP